MFRFILKKLMVKKVKYKDITKMFIFLKYWKLKAWFKVTKWIFDLEHLQTLVEVISLLKFLAHPETSDSIDEFLWLAKKVLQHGSHFSKWEVYRLRTLLREISADPEICKLLGRNEPIIGGGTFFEAWSSAKMFAFVNHVQSYKKYPNKRVYHFEFDFQQMDSDTTVNDIQLLNRNRGSFHRQNIHEMYVRGEVDYSKKGTAAAKITALETPRGTPRRTSMVTPRDTPRLPQMESPRELSREPPMESPREVLPYSRTPRSSRLDPSAAPGDVFFFIQTFLSESLLNFLLSAHSITGLEKSGPIWDLYSHLHGYIRNPYGVSYVIYRPYLQETFLSTLAGSELVRCALTVHLSKEYSDRSLAILRLQSKEQQERFFSILKTMVIKIAEWYSDQKDDVLLYDCPEGGFWRQNPETLKLSYLKPSKRSKSGPYTTGESVQSA